MDEDHSGMQEPVEARDAPEQYVAPTLTDVGSFEELTRNSTSGSVDFEGQS
jgi:hypothetical protein